MTDKILNQLISLHIIHREDVEIYRFGLENLLLKILHYTSYLFIAVLSHEMPGFLVFFSAFLLLRKSSGGYHAKTKFGCYIYSCATVLGAIMCIKFLPAINGIEHVCVILLLLCDIVIWMIALLGNRNRELDKEESLLLKKKIRIYLLIENILVITLIITEHKVFALAMFLAIGCQAMLLLLEKSREGFRFVPLLFLLLAVPGTQAYAKETMSNQESEIVLVLDCSQSMQTVDEQNLCFEFIREFTASVPYSCQIGVVAYHNEAAVSLPLGSSYEEIDEALQSLEYRYYGNAGIGMQEAVSLFGSSQSDKRIILISDGEILMSTEQATEESAELYRQAVQVAKDRDIKIDILALGERIGEGNTVYYASEMTGGKIYDLKTGGELQDFTDELIFQEMRMPGRMVGTLEGVSGELSIELPDCLMKSATIVLTGRQQNENLTVNCEADKITAIKGNYYTVLKLEKPVSEQIKIQMSSENIMSVKAYLIAEYEFSTVASSSYNIDTGQAEIRVELKNIEGNDLLAGHLKDGGLDVLIEGNPYQYEIEEGNLVLNLSPQQERNLSLELSFKENFAVYFGERIVNTEVKIPEAPEEEETSTDWILFVIILFFVLALLVIFCMTDRKKRNNSEQKKMIDESRIYQEENAAKRSDFYGKIMVFVIRSRDDIDYPPESINLFARCNREVITLEWILETCNLPLNLKGSEKIIFKPGEDRSLVIKNGSVAAALKGRELLAKGHSYHLYYHEKVTFIFDQEDTEIEVHYKDLKPNER